MFQLLPALILLLLQSQSFGVGSFSDSHSGKFFCENCGQDFQTSSGDTNYKSRRTLVLRLIAAQSPRLSNGPSIRAWLLSQVRQPTNFFEDSSSQTGFIEFASPTDNHPGLNTSQRFRDGPF